MEPEKEIERLKNEKLDKILLENVSTAALEKTDVDTDETGAVKEIKSLLLNLINKLKSK